MTKTPDLRTTQNWMQAVLTQPEGIAAGLTSSEAQSWFAIDETQLELVISRSKALSAIDRLAIYHNAYFARLVECLQAEFPALNHAAGQQAFTSFVVGYLQSCPSTSYTLNQLGSGFADYLRQARPPRSPGEREPDWADFLIDLATLERLYSEVFDGPGEEQIQRLTSQHLLIYSPAQWPKLRFQFGPSFRLLTLGFPVHEYCSAIRRGDPPPVPEPSETFLVIHRRDFIVRRRAVSQEQFQILHNLKAGASLELALAPLLDDPARNIAQLADEVRSWFADWAREGYFTAVIDSAEESSRPF